MRRLFNGIVAPAALALLVTAVPALAQGKGGTKDTTTNRRAFYLTKFIQYGHQAAQACDDGFHMASVWELLDVGSLKYDTARGFTSDDAGAGPPTGMRGWIRTGFQASPTGAAGISNCGAWTSADFTSVGSMVRLTQTWSQTPTVTGPWVSSTQYCAEPERVWCVQD